MPSMNTHREHTAGNGGYSAVREQAYQESMRKLAAFTGSRTSFTAAQARMAENDHPFEFGSR